MSGSALLIFYVHFCLDAVQNDTSIHTRYFIPLGHCLHPSAQFVVGIGAADLLLKLAIFLLQARDELLFPPSPLLHD